MSAVRISATDLARKLSEVMNRVLYRGEEFIVERNGEEVCRLAPVGPPRTVTAGEAFAALHAGPHPDDDFAAELAELRRQRPPAREPRAWPES